MIETASAIKLDMMSSSHGNQVSCSYHNLPNIKPSFRQDPEADPAGGKRGGGGGGGAIREKIFSGDSTSLGGGGERKKGGRCSFWF